MILRHESNSTNLLGVSDCNAYFLCKNAAELLMRVYPDHLWAVSFEHGVMNIRDLNLAGKWGYTLHPHTAYSSSEWDKRVLMAGGEILERYQQARGRFNEAHVLSLPKDVAGNRRPEL